MGNFAVISDIHGCGKTLKKLLARLGDYKNLYCVGDLIDRGPHIPLVIEAVKEYNIKPVMGNHEWLCLRAVNGSRSDYNTWLYNGGDYTLNQFNTRSALDALRSFIKTFPYYYEIENYLICHAGVHRGLSLRQAIDHADSPHYEENNLSIIWNRNDIFLKDRFIISGHTPLRRIKITPHYCNIDTGCVYGHKLTAIILPEKKIIQENFSE